MDGFRHQKHHVYGIEEQLSALQYYSPYLKKYAEDLERTVSHLRRGFVSEIERLNVLLNEAETEKARLYHHLRKSEKERDHYRRERDGERKFLRHFDELRRVQTLDNQVETLREELDKITKDKDAKIRSYHAAYEDLADTKQRMHQDFTEQIRQQALRIQELEDRLRRQREVPAAAKPSPQNNSKSTDEQLIFQLMQQLRQAEADLEQTKSELEDTKMRLSKVAGDRLTDNNPNITNLSDKNRPVKIAERFSELYDNQWTDAVESLNRNFKTEEQTIAALLEVVQDAMLFCKTTAKTQMENLQGELALSNNMEERYIPASLQKHLKDCRKSSAALALTNLQKMYTARIKQSSNQTLRVGLEITHFVSECVELCWLMVIQDPPVVFAPIVGRGSPLDRDLYKLYTVTGPDIDYMVWPALLLHDGGPVLAKGVAQGFVKIDNGRFDKDRVDRAGAEMLPESTGKVNDKMQRQYGSDPQDKMYRNGYNSDRNDRDSHNSYGARDDRPRKQQIATVDPIQVHSSRT